MTESQSPLTMLFSRHTKRREFITLLGGAAAAWPRAAHAQQSAKLPTVGFLGQSTPLGEGERAVVFAQRLREFGWIEGRTVAIEYRWAGGQDDRLAEIAAEFVRLKVDISGSTFCATPFRASAVWRSWAMSAIRSLCWN